MVYWHIKYSFGVLVHVLNSKQIIIKNIKIKINI